MRRFLLIVVVALGALVVLPPLWFSVFPEDVPALAAVHRMIPVGGGVSSSPVRRGSGRPGGLVAGRPRSAPARPCRARLAHETRPPLPSSFRISRSPVPRGATTDTS